jgi:hypothetical protein
MIGFGPLGSAPLASGPIQLISANDEVTGPDFISIDWFRKKLLACCYLVSLSSHDGLVEAEIVASEYGLLGEIGWMQEAVNYFQSQGYIGLPLMFDDKSTVSIEGTVPIFNGPISGRFLFTELGKEVAKGSLKSAMMGVDESAFVPASDRIVKLSDNQPALDSALRAVFDLKVQLELGNDIGNLSLDELEVAKREVYWLEHALQQDALRLDWMERVATNCLKWIAVKASEQVIGSLAIEALKAIGKLMGFGN